MTSTEAEEAEQQADRDTGARRSRAEQQQLTRSRLLAAAAEVFAEHGFGGASLDAIATRAGYTRGAVYSNFADKAEILIALIDREAEAFRTERLPLLLALPDEQRALAVASWLIEDDLPEQLFLLLELARLRGADAGASEALEQVLATISTAIDGALRSGSIAGVPDDASRRAVTEGVLVVLLGVRSLRLIHGAPSTEVVARLLTTVLDTAGSA
jgi:AcrR family transcriptional regulator